MPRVGWAQESAQGMSTRQGIGETQDVIARQVLASAPDSVLALDREFRVVSFNTAAERLVHNRFGFLLANGLDFLMAIREHRPDQAEERRQLWSRALSGEHFDSVEQWECPRICTYHVVFSPVRDDAGEIVGAMQVARNLTSKFASDDFSGREVPPAPPKHEIHSVETALRRSEQRYRLLNRATSDIIWDWDLASDNVQWNDAVIPKLGYQPKEINGHVRFWVENLHADDRQRVVTHIHRVLAGKGEYWREEYRFQAKNGSYRTFLDRGFIQRDDSGRAIRMIGSMVDLTERIEAQRELERRERALIDVAQQREETLAILDSLLAHAPIGFAYFDRDHRYVRVNDYLAEINGIDAIEHVGRTLRDIVPHNAAAVEPIIDRVFEKGENVAVEIHGETRSQPGVPRDWLTYFYPVRSPKGETVWVGAAVLEITERKQAESELRVQNQINRILTENAATGMFMMNDHGQVNFMNPAAERVTGYSFEELSGQFLHDVLHRNHADGSSIPRDRCPIVQALVQGKEIKFHTDEFQRKDGTFFPVQIWISPIVREGKPAGAVLEVRDITEQRKAEQALMQSEKLASVGRMAATVAHEINNPLEAVTNLIYLAQTDPSVPRHVHNYLTMADRELGRVAHITRQTLGFYRENSNPSQVCLSQLVDEVANIYSSRFTRRGIRFERRVESERPVTGIGGELRQVLSNLISNAIDAVPQRGNILVRLKQAKQNGCEGMQITVADNGPGIPKEKRSRIFEAFFTTKKDVGTGLGLWVTRGIVQKHKGTIRVRSQQHKTREFGGSGWTVFSIFLPANAAPAQPQTNAA